MKTLARIANSLAEIRISFPNMKQECNRLIHDTQSNSLTYIPMWTICSSSLSETSISAKIKIAG
jgi:hypothetical protein